MPALVAAALSLVLYAVTLGGTFIYDDLYIARDDPRLASPDRWRYFWTDQYFPEGADKLFRPLTSMTYALQAYTTGDRAWPFHVVNWLLAAACAAAVTEFSRRLAGWWPGLIAGLLFAAHPIHVEAVAGIVGRAELMCALATIGGLTLYVGKRLTARRVAAIVACCIAALLSKEQGIFFPLLLAMLAGLQWLGRRRNPAPAAMIATPDLSQRRLGVILAMCLVYVIAGYFFYRETILPLAWDRALIEWGLNPMVVSNGADRWLMPLVILGRYTALLLWPHTLSVDYGAEVIGSSVRWGEPWFYVGVLVVIGSVVLLVRSLRRRDVPVAFCTLAAGLLYGVVSNLPSIIGTILAERLMFLPSAFLAVLAGIGITRFAAGSMVRRRTAMIAVFALLLLGSLRTYTYALRWNDPLALYAVALQEHPKSVQLHRGVFAQYASQGRWTEARQIGESCVAAAPNYWRSYVLVASADIELGHIQRARELLQYAKDHHYNNELIGAWMRLEGRIEQLSGGPATQLAE